MRAPGTGAARVLLLAVTGAAVLLGPALPPASAATAGTTAVVARAVSPTGTAILRGVLLFGTSPVPVTGEKVTLHGVADGADPLTLQTTTDTKGRFVFTGLAGGKEWTYTVTSVRSGVTFSSDVLSVDAAATKTFTLSVYDATTSSAAITWPEWLVWLDVKGSTLAVQQDVTLRNTGQAAYTGSEPVANAPDNGKAAVTLPVGAGATNLAYLGFFEVCCDALSASSWAHTRPVPPGDSTGTMRYEAPTPATLTFPVTVTTGSFQLLVPTGTEVSSPQLTASGTQTDGPTTYQVLKGGPFPVGTTVTVTLAGVASGTPWGWIVAGLAVVVLAIGGWWFWRRRRAPAVVTPAKGAKAPTKPAKGTKPAPRPAVAKAAARPPAKPARAATAATPAPAAETPSAHPADADVLADELAMLDLAHDNGALPDEESYQRVRESLVTRLMAALGEDPDALEGSKN